MPRSLLAPRWLALHAATLAVIAGFLLLGRWQVDAYRDHDARERRAAARTEQPVPLTSVLSPGGRVVDGTDGRTVTVSGRYDSAAQLLVPGRRLDGRTGFGVVTPLRTAAGTVVVVDRGWVADAAAAMTGLPDTEVSVTGVLRGNEPDSRRRGTTSGAAGREISAVSTAELLRSLPYPPQHVYDGHVVLTAQQPSAIGGPTPVPVAERRAGVAAWRNLSYGLQWWLFAAATVFAWGLLVRGRRRTRADDDERLVGSA